MLEVREPHGIEMDAADTVERDGVGRHLEGGGFHAAFSGQRHELLKDGRLGGRARRVHFVVADALNAGALQQRGQAGTLEDLVEEVRGRRLSVRPRDPDGDKVGRRVAVDQSGDGALEVARIVDDDDRRPGPVAVDLPGPIRVGEDGDGAGVEGGRCKDRAVRLRTRDRDKQVAGRDVGRVDAHPGDCHLAVGTRPDRAGDLAEGHRGHGRGTQLEGLAHRGQSIEPYAPAWSLAFRAAGREDTSA